MTPEPQQVTIRELKARAYDMIVAIERMQQRLAQINQTIAQGTQEAEARLNELKPKNTFKHPSKVILEPKVENTEEENTTKIDNV